MIYAKAILNLSANLLTDADGSNVLSFEYIVKDNYDDDTSEFDSETLYTYLMPVSQISLKLVTNNVSTTADYFEITAGKNQIGFAIGEYYSLDSNTLLEVSQVYSLIFGAIYP